MSAQGNDFYIVKTQADLDSLPFWLQNRSYTSIRDGFTDKNGKPMVGLQKSRERAGLILILEADFEDRVVEMAQESAQADDDGQALHKLPGRR
jgi:hypothetical protein